MKRVLFVGFVALGSMSFIGTENIQIEEGDVDCFAKADGVIEDLREDTYFLHPDVVDAVWDDVFYNCSALNGQLLELAIIE
ncbi:hypothetical protein [Nonlabens agnitus]|nr:hypothetical protein [Nonlabens agnitus]